MCTQIEWEWELRKDESQGQAHWRGRDNTSKVAALVHSGHSQSAKGNSGSTQLARDDKGCGEEQASPTWLLEPVLQRENYQDILSKLMRGGNGEHS